VIAAIMAAAGIARRILVPANLHRSAVSGMALSGLEPVSYQPAWSADFGFYEQVDVETIESALSASGAGALLVVSPTYQGAMSDIAAIAAVCKKRGILLIVDEAHGAHLLKPDSMPVSALSCGADIVIHSLHKTLPALTQTGVLHIAHDSRFALDHLRSLLSCLQSSSPSYPLMTSVEYTVDYLEKDAGRKCLQNVFAQADRLRSAVRALDAYDIYVSSAIHEPLHVLLKARFPVELSEELQARGIGIEASFNQSVLLLLGMGTQESDVTFLLSALAELAEIAKAQEPKGQDAGSKLFSKHSPPPLFQQAIETSRVLSAPSHVVPVEDAIGRTCMECIAPCPPGTPVVVPGQLLTEEVIGYVLKNTGIRSIRVAQNHNT